MNSSKKIGVYLVDDHPMVREWLTNLIAQQPDLVVCGEAEDCSTALKQIVNILPEVAIIDLSLKNGSGLELIKDLKIQAPEVAVLVLSMHDDMLYAERALKAGARGYVMKRETAKKIIGAIRKIILGELCVSEKLAAVMTEKYLGGGREKGSPLEVLSDRELEVFQLIGQGNGTHEIANRLNVNYKTVQSYSARIKEKLSLGGSIDLLRHAIRWEEFRQSQGTPPKM